MIVVSEMMHPDGLSALSGHIVQYDPDLYQDRPRLKMMLARATGLIVRNRTRVDGDLLDAAPQLRAVGRLGVGLDNIDTEALQDRRISLVVPYGANAVAVAEYVMAALLTVRRRIAEQSLAVRAGIWDRKGVQHQLQARTLSVLGYGATGQAVVRRAEAFGMEVRVYDPYAPRVPDRLRVRDWDSLLKNADYLTLHAPLTSETRHCINRSTLRQLPARAILVNTARGELIDEQALVEALEHGRMGGAILDVREQEPPGPSDPLARYPNVWLTPHIAGLTVEAQQAIAVTVASRVGELAGKLGFTRGS
ncbi:MAG: hydroxyacid dehydrogenase [Thermaerobacter sp.]|nr:hydroxyacid dehydrogenase [Thermaerobacter sp.]